MAKPKKRVKRPTEKQLRALWDACVAWRDSVKVLAPECFGQSDRVILSLGDLGEEVCNVIGYSE